MPILFSCSSKHSSTSDEQRLPNLGVLRFDLVSFIFDQRYFSDLNGGKLGGLSYDSNSFSYDYEYNFSSELSFQESQKILLENFIARLSEESDYEIKWTQQKEAQYLGNYSAQDREGIINISFRQIDEETFSLIYSVNETEKQLE